MGVAELTAPSNDRSTIRLSILVAAFVAAVVPSLDAAIAASALVAVVAFALSTRWLELGLLPVSLRVLHLSVGLFTLGIVIRIAEAAVAGGEFVFPGIADVVIFPAYLLAIWGYGKAAMSRHALAKAADFLDAAAMSIVFGTLVLPFTVDFVTHASTGTLERAAWLGYFGVEVLFFGVVLLIVMGPGARTPGVRYLVITGFFTSAFDQALTVLLDFGFVTLADQGLRLLTIPLVTYCVATSFANYADFARPGVRPQRLRWGIYGVGFVILGVALVVERGAVEIIGFTMLGLVASLRIGAAHTVASRLEELNDAQQALASELADADTKQAVLTAGRDACLRLLPANTAVVVDVPDTDLSAGSRIGGPTVNVASSDGSVRITTPAEKIRPHHWSAFSQIADVLALANEAVEARSERVSELVKADWRALSGTDNELVFVVDGGQRVVKATPNVEVVLGNDPIGGFLPDLLNESDLSSALVGGKEIVSERDDRWLSITAQRSGNDTQVVTVRDVTARLRAELVDPVTGLNNMAHFSRLGQIEAATLIVFQIADFARINDMAGKAGADQLLRDVGNQLTGAFREGIDLVWRNHGPSFAVLCQGPDKPDQWILDRRDLVANAVDGAEHIASFTLNTAVVPIDEPVNVADALHQADVAIAFDRVGRRGGIARYTDEVADRAQREYRIESALAAVTDPATAGFRVHYQPIVEAGTERVARVEALLRWNHSTIGPVRPDEFIPAAERSGRVGILDQFVMEVASRDLRDVQALDPSIHMQINLSPVGLSPERIRAIGSWVRNHCDDPPSLTIEIIESAIDEDFDDLLPAFRELRDAGVGVSVDDFGVGHSSMERIANPAAPWTQVKLAGVFATDIHPDTVARVIDTIHSLEFEVVVENVEEREQADMMTDAGADFIQGWLFSRDLPLDELVEFVGSYELSRVQGRSNR